MPPTTRRPAPTYRAPRRHRSRLPIVLLLVVTLGVGAYLLLGRHNSSGASNPTGFVATSQNLAAAAHSVLDDAGQVQRFLELHSYDAKARRRIVEMQGYLNHLQSIAGQSSGTQHQLAENQVTAAREATAAAIAFRLSVAFSYKLSNANLARQTLALALAEIEHNIKAWNQT